MKERLRSDHANLFVAGRTLVYLEGDATMRTYEDGEGRKQNALSLVQTKLEVLKRPGSTSQDSEGGALGV